MINLNNKAVLIVTYDWAPSAEVGAVRVQKIAAYLRKEGWTPIILTVKESHYERVFKEQSDGSFHVLRTGCIPSPLKAYSYVKKIFGKLRSQSRPSLASMEKVDLKVTSSPRSPLTSARKLVLSLLYTPDEFQGWLPFAIPKAISAIKTHHISHLITSGPPFSTHLVGLVAKLWGRSKLKWVADFRDPWVANEQRIDLTTTSVSNYFNRVLEKLVIGHADSIVCVTPSMTDWYRKRYPLVSDSVWQTITNGFEQNEFNQIPLEASPNRFTISYIGSIEYERSPAALLQAVAELCREGIVNKRRVSIRFIGKCGIVQGQTTTELIRDWDLEDVVELVGLVPRAEALREMKSAHVLLLLANAQRLQVPGKAYEYIGAGPFILAVTEEHGATADFVRRVGEGAIVPPGDHSAVKRALQDRYEQFVQNTPMQTIEHKSLRPTAILNEYEWSQLGARYAELLS